MIDVATRDIKKRISIPAHSPRTLLASSDGTTVWVASYLSGNGTTVIPHKVAPAPPTPSNPELPDAPRQGIIVSANDSRWKSQIGYELKIPLAGDGSRVGGFGFGADGSKASLREFLADSHRFQGITEQDKAALESFLLSFPTETPPIVGFTRTVHAANRNDELIQSDVAFLIEQAQLGNCWLSVTGLLRGERIELVYDRASGLFRDGTLGYDELGLEQIMSRIDNSESFVSLVAKPLEVGD